MTSLKAICSEGTVNIWSLRFPKGGRSILIHGITLEPRSKRDGRVNHVRVLESSARESEGQWTRPLRNTAQHIRWLKRGCPFPKQTSQMRGRLKAESESKVGVATLCKVLSVRCRMISALIAIEMRRRTGPTFWQNYFGDSLEKVRQGGPRWEDSGSFCQSVTGYTCLG